MRAPDAVGPGLALAVETDGCGASAAATALGSGRRSARAGGNVPTDLGRNSGPDPATGGGGPKAALGLDANGPAVPGLFAAVWVGGRAAVRARQVRGKREGRMCLSVPPKTGTDLQVLDVGVLRVLIQQYKLESCTAATVFFWPSALRVSLTSRCNHSMQSTANLKFACGTPGHALIGRYSQRF